MVGFAQLLKLTGLSESTVKNWQHGRPLRIRPRLQVGKGRGARALYTLEDVMRLCIVKKLVEAGFAASRLQPLVDELEDGLLQAVRGDSFLMIGPEMFDVGLWGRKPGAKHYDVEGFKKVISSAPQLGMFVLNLEWLKEVKREWRKIANDEGRVSK